MPVTDIQIAGYRSIRKIRFPVRQLSVLVGGNGVGKTNLYRALELLHAAALGAFAEEIAREGGLASVMWAGERRVTDKPVLTLSATFEDITGGGYAPNLSITTGFAPSYGLETGFPQPTAAAFPEEAQIKSEMLSMKAGNRTVSLLERRDSVAWARDTDGRRVQAAEGLLASETALSALRGGFPEVDAVREALSSWRFYHAFRTDAASPLRRPGLATTAPTLNADGSNLAAVFATIRHIREDTTDLDEAIDQAFPGAALEVPVPDKTSSFSLVFPEFRHRPFGAAELSDGTLHFLALMGALLSYRLPPFIALNEPENSLHPSLLPALARVIAKAATRTQVWVVTHSRELADSLASETGVLPRQVIRKDGGTWLEGLNDLGFFPDED